MTIEINDKTFEDLVIKNSETKAVLVDFWAPWCTPCSLLTPILETIAKDLGDNTIIGKVNVDENPVIAGKFSIRSIPTIIIFKEGKPVETLFGVKPYNDIVFLLKKYM